MGSVLVTPRARVGEIHEPWPRRQIFSKLRCLLRVLCQQAGGRQEEDVKNCSPCMTRKETGKWRGRWLGQGHMPGWVREASIPEELGFLDPETAFSGGPTSLCARGRGACAGTHVAREVVEAQHHDEDHRGHGVLRRHRGQPAGQRRIGFPPAGLGPSRHPGPDTPSSLSTFTSRPGSHR